MVETLFGALELQRSYYYRPDLESNGRFPLDEALGLIDGYSPGLARLMCRAGAQSPCEMASADLKAYGGSPNPEDDRSDRAGSTKMDRSTTGT